MSIKDRVKSLLKEADLYKSQRLLKESKSKYLEAIKLIQTYEQIPNRKNLIGAITKKIEALDAGIVKWDKSANTPEVSTKVQDLIQKLFTTEDAKDTGAVKTLKSAITLAKFGQYSRAIAEFNKLLSVDSVAVPAAKYSLKCMIESGSIDDAVNQYRQWEADNVLSTEKITIVKKFFQDILDKKGAGVNLDESADIIENTVEEPGIIENDLMDNDDEDIIDITSIGIRFSHGPKQGEHVELDVSFQAGNVLSLIVSSKDSLLIDSLKVGVTLDDMDFYSPIAIFKGSGIVEANTKIESGPKRGDYSLDIKIHSI